MSDIRTKLLLGTTIGALAMIFVMAVGVDSFKTNTTVSDTEFQIMGHVTVMAVHPDGSVSYAQGDNSIQQLGRDAALLQLFDRGTSATTGVFDCIRIGDGPVPVSTGKVALDSVMNDGTTALQICDDSGGTTNTELSNEGTINSTSTDIISEFTILAGDLTAGTVTITEAVLENSGGLVVSHVELGSPVPAVLGTVVTITYSITVV